MTPHRPAVSQRRPQSCRTAPSVCSAVPHSAPCLPPGCPLTQTIGDSGSANAFGDGLLKGEEDKTSTFFVDTQGRRGDLKVNVEGPNSVAKVSRTPREGREWAACCARGAPCTVQLPVRVDAALTQSYRAWLLPLTVSGVSQLVVGCVVVDTAHRCIQCTNRVVVSTTSR